MPEFKIALKNCGKIKPFSIESYINHQGYLALKKTLQMTPLEIIKEIKRSKLRGRGGAAFPTGLKWEAVAQEKYVPKYIICNADEGEPGTFKDRVILSQDPHKIIEAMTIAAFSVGAQIGFIYLRLEYPEIFYILERAIIQAKNKNYLGKNILNTGFSFDIQLKSGAGAYICGEETALIKSVEGKRAEPVPKPPYPTTCGLFGRPTLINNVETLANIPAIILNGSTWFSEIGTKESKGTKVFSVSGDIKKPQAIEVPMGTALKELLELCAGVEGSIKAIQVGGPSGKLFNCLEGDGLNLSLSYETYLGAGAVIVFNTKRNLIEMTRSFLEFFTEESCGKCVPCREGIPQLLHIIKKILSFKANREDLNKLEKMCKLIKITSLCGLGKTAPGSILDTLKEFPEEYSIYF
ncbi:MAG: SLBB domain-containing protein [Armatimonadetes bacterium]|nr:SLBB domain-containing protein [Armatimonadota bacterium]